MKYIVSDSSLIRNQNGFQPFNKIFDSIIELIVKNNSNIETYDYLNRYKLLLPFTIALECIWNPSNYDNQDENALYQLLNEKIKNNFENIEILASEFRTITQESIFNSFSNFYKDNFKREQIGYKDYLIILEFLNFARIKFSDIFLFISCDLKQINFLKKQINNNWLKKRIKILYLNPQENKEAYLQLILENEFFNTFFYMGDQDADEESQEHLNFSIFERFTYRFNTEVYYNKNFYENYIRNYIINNIKLLTTLNFDWKNYSIDDLDVLLYDCRSINDESILIFNAWFILNDQDNMILFNTLIISYDAFDIVDNLYGVHKIIFVNEKINIDDPDNLEELNESVMEELINKVW